MYAVIISLSVLFHRKQYPSPTTTHLFLIWKNTFYKWQVWMKKTLIRGRTWNIGYHLHPQPEFPKQVVSKPEPHLFQIWKPGSRRESVKPYHIPTPTRTEITPLGQTWAQTWEARSLNAVRLLDYLLEEGLRGKDNQAKFLRPLNRSNRFLNQYTGWIKT